MTWRPRFGSKCVLELEDLNAGLPEIAPIGVSRNWFVDGYCPFLLCLEVMPHEHPVCLSCEAVKYGNMYCQECVAHWEFYDARFLQLRLRMGRHN